MTSRDSDAFLRNIRASLAKWKQEQLVNTTQDAQDTRKLNDYLKMTGLAYTMIKKYLDTHGKMPTDPILKDIVDSIGSLENLSIEKQILLEDALFRDLIEYPFTYNMSLINSFEQRNVLNTNIIPNK